MIPPLGHLVIAMIKNSAIIGVSLLALPDLLKEARIVKSQHVRDQRGLLLGGVGYLILTVPATFVVRYLERRFAITR